MSEPTVPIPGPRGPAPAAGGDEAIPMLTEIVQVPRYAPEELPAALAGFDEVVHVAHASSSVLRSRLRPMVRHHACFED